MIKLISTLASGRMRLLQAVANAVHAHASTKLKKNRRLMATRTVLIRPALLSAAYCLVWASFPAVVAARDLIPAQPSVEVNLDALRGISPAPEPVVEPASAPVTSRKGKGKAAKPTSNYQAPETMPRQVPAEQPLPDGSARPYIPKEITKKVRSPRPEPVQSAPVVAPPAVEQPVVALPVPVIEKPFIPAAKPKMIAPLPEPKAAPELPAITPPPLVEMAPVVATPKPVSPPAIKATPALIPPPLSIPDPVSPPKKITPLDVPAAIVKEKPPVAPPSVPAALPVAKVAPRGPDLGTLDFTKMPVEPTVVDKPKTVFVPPIVRTSEPLPLPEVPAAPAAKKVTPPEKMPVPQIPPLVQPDVKKIIAPTLPPPLPMPELAPIEKAPTKLPPSVEKRLDKIILPSEPKQQGLISDKTRIEDPTIKIKEEMKAAKEKEAADKKLEAEKKAAAEKEAKEKVAKEIADKKLEAEKKAAAEKEAPKKPAPPVLPVLKSEPVVPAIVETKKPAAPLASIPPAPLALPPLVPPPLPMVKPEPIKKDVPPVALEKLPPAELPAPTVKVEQKPAELLPVKPVTLPKTEIATLPKLDAKLPAPLGTLDLPKPPSLGPVPSAPLPKLTEVAPAPPSNLPSLTALTGGKAPSTLDILQPKDGVESKPLASPMGVAKPTIPTPLPSIKTMEPAKKIDQAPPPLPLPPVAAKLEKPAPDAVLPSPAKSVEKEPVKAAAPVVAPPPIAVPALNTQAVQKLTRTISFGKDKADLTDDAKSDLSDIADKMKQSQGTVRVTAYASGTAEQASVAKRISLSRALAIRAFLISKGVNQLSINVQALGNQVPSGDADRADVFVK